MKRCDLMKKAHNVLSLILLAVFFMFIGFHLCERVLLNRFMSDNALELDDKDMDHIIALRDKVAQNFNDGNKGVPFKQFIVAKRPKYGESLTFILRNMEGRCGEFTRLMYHVLHENGVKSRPVIIYKSSGEAHSILEVKSEGGWFLLDTMNSSPGLTEHLNDVRAPITSFRGKSINYRNAPLIKLLEYKLFSYYNSSFLTYRISGTCIYHTKPIPDWLNDLLSHIYLLFGVAILLLLGLINIRRMYKVIFRLIK